MGGLYASNRRLTSTSLAVLFSQKQASDDSRSECIHRRITHPTIPTPQSQQRLTANVAPKENFHVIRSVEPRRFTAIKRYSTAPPQWFRRDTVKAVKWESAERLTAHHVVGDVAQSRARDARVRDGSRRGPAARLRIYQIEKHKLSSWTKIHARGRTERKQNPRGVPVRWEGGL